MSSSPSSPSPSSPSSSSSSSWWSLIPSWRWVPTSPQKLEDAEGHMMSAVQVPYERMMVRVGKGDDYINTIKAGSGPPLVLLHGFGAGIGFWCGNIDALSKRYTVYAMDMLGFGRSSRPRITFKTPEQAEDFFTTSIEEWAQSMNLKKFVLLGHSFGGYVSACYALKHSERVAHLVLADPWGIPARPVQTEGDVSLKQRVAVKVLTMGNPLLAMRALGPYGPWLVAKTRPDIPAKFDHLHKSSDVVINYLYHTNAQSPPTGEQAFSSLTESLGWARLPLINRLNTLPASVPTTFIYGRHTWMDKDAGLALSQSMTGPTDLLEVSHSGHHLYIDNSRDFNAAVIAVADHVTRGDPALAHAPRHVHHSSVRDGGGVTEKVLTE